MGDFTVANGEARSMPEGLVIRPDPSGKIYLTLDVRDLDLSRYSLVRIKAASEVPVQYFLLWKTKAHGEQLFQYNVEHGQVSGDTVLLDMAGRARWEGQASMVGLGIFVPGRREITLSRFDLHRPGLPWQVTQLMEEWAGYLPWGVRDSNLYTGTSGYGRGIQPVPLVAAGLGAALLAYLLWLLSRGRLRAFDWRVAGGLTLVAWLLLDALWQYRLGARALVTLEHKRGKTFEEIQLASQDGELLQFVNEVRPLIEGENARIFMVTRSDFYGMLASYYLTPWNTYWNRFGPELPNHQHIRSGDYLLLMRPTLANFNPQRNVLTFPDGEEVEVEALHVTAFGGLLRVI